MTSEHHGGFRGLPAQPAAGRGLVPRGDADAAGPRRARCCCRCGRRRSWPRRSRGWRRASPAGSGWASPRVRSPADFEVMHVPMDDARGALRRAASTELAGMLDGTAAGCASPTIRRSRRCGDHPVPVLSAAMGFTAVRRAARARGAACCSTRCRRRNGAASSSTPTATPAAAAPCVLIRRAWVGEPPRDARRRPGRRVPQLLVEVARWSTGGATSWSTHRRPTTSSAGLLDALERAGADALNLRVHVPGVSPDGSTRADRRPRRGGAPPTPAAR